MNVENDSNTTQSTVASKYFSGKNDMDDSLSDFKEIKKPVIGTKSTKTSTKVKSKRVAKKIKGQKDIRTVLKPKKNELVKYTEEFEDICKKSGVDIDAEQLQLAIAISKSLQSDSEAVCSSPKLNSQERKSRIRTTLQEYGFKIPEIKTTKRVKKCKRVYKLLTKTDAEKQQITSDRYSQVLLRNFESVDRSYTQKETSFLYNIATNAVYDVLKDNHVYYVDSLIEKSSTNGCLFKDYAKIPGRPVSPKLLEESKMNFSDIECSPGELDSVLSGAIKIAKNILKSKQKIIGTNVGNKSANNEILSNNSANITTENHGIFYNACEDIRNLRNEDDDCNRQIIVSQTICRSCSPDLFDDEVSCTLDDDVRINHTQIDHGILSENKDTKDTIFFKQSIKEMFQGEEPNNSTSTNRLKGTESISSRADLDNNKKCISPATNEGTKISAISMLLIQNTEITKRKSDDFMDLTECIKTDNVFSREKHYTQISQNDATKRKSNDFMEITECVNVMDHIDLTQDNSKKDLEANKNDVENIDLTQSSNSNDSNYELPFVCLNKSQSLDATVLLDENEYSNTKRNASNVNNTITGVFVEKKANESVFDDFIHNHSETSKESSDTEANVSIYNKLSETSTRNKEKVDLSLSVNNYNELSPEFDLEYPNLQHSLKNGAKRTLKTPTEFNEIFDIDVRNGNNKRNNCHNLYNKDKSDDIDINLTQHFNFDNKNNQATYSSKDKSETCDLTQSSDSLDEESNLNDNLPTNISSDDNKECTTPRNNDCDLDLTQYTFNYNNVIETSSKNSNLGKNYKLSIDYDEVYNNYDIQGNSSNNVEKDFAVHNENSVAYDGVTQKSDNEANCSQKSEVFEISDKELDYSLNMSSRYENFEIGGLSIIDNISRIDRQTIDRVKNNDCPEKYASEDSINFKATPKVIPTKQACIKTPGNSEYMIKTDEITPMLNYAALSTPERNKELHKYGIKPLKRKRAIQLLTHLYNQTHPIVDSQSELSSPSKKLCTDKARLKSPSNLESECTPRTSTYRLNLRKKSVSPKRKSSQYTTTPKKVSKLRRDDLKTPEDLKTNHEVLKLDDDDLGVNSKENVYRITTEVPCIKNIDCDEEDMVFQKRENAKVHSCLVPLHIAFHNYISSRNGLREAILRYEPVNIDVIHKELVGYGHRYDPKDLLMFMDKKCITVKMSENDTRNERY